jgi:putative restriction endonuclease
MISTFSFPAKPTTGIRSFVNKTGRAFAPTDPHERPHPRFLQWHRENCFKQ